MKVGPDGKPTLDFANLTPEQLAALSEVTVETVAGKAGREVLRVRFKLHEKRAALVDIARLNGWTTQPVDPEEAPDLLTLIRLSMARKPDQAEPPQTH
jgi:hypothetical protein